MKTLDIEIPNKLVSILIEPYTPEEIKELEGKEITVYLQFDFFDLVNRMTYDIESTYDYLIFNDNACLTDYSFELFGATGSNTVIVKLDGLVTSMGDDWNE